MDVLIPFQSSINNDEELRMTLRSMDKFLYGLGHAWVVGDKPKWAYNDSQLTVIPIGNAYNATEFRERNVANKIIGAFASGSLPPEVLVSHDDNFITTHCDIDIWPWYNSGRDWKAKGDYADTQSNTKEVLGDKIDNYDIHCPHRMTKEGVWSSIKNLDWTVKHGYCQKTIYCTMNRVWGEFYTDLKINAQYDLIAVEDMITAGRRFFSCGDRAYMPGVRQWLLNKFPDKSKFEC